MNKISLLATCALAALFGAPQVLASDVDRNPVTGSRIKQLPSITVQDPVAEKAPVTADNRDLDEALQAILAEAEAAEFDD